jgi:hypothetical protein
MTSGHSAFHDDKRQSRPVRQRLAPWRRAIPIEEERADPENIKPAVAADPPAHILDAADVADVSVAAPHPTMRDMVEEADPPQGS